MVTCFKNSSYTPVTLAVIFSRIYELVLLNRLNERLVNSYNQTFRRDHSTLMPILLLKEL